MLDAEGLAAGEWDPEVAEFAAAMSPAAVAALVPMLRMVAERAEAGKGPIASSVQYHLDAFAARLLREEDHDG